MLCRLAFKGAGGEGVFTSRPALGAVGQALAVALERPKVRQQPVRQQDRLGALEMLLFGSTVIGDNFVRADIATYGSGRGTMLALIELLALGTR